MPTKVTGTPAKQYGTKGPITQSTVREWSYHAGETTVYRWVGDSVELQKKYNEIRLSGAGFGKPDYDSARFDPRRGIGVLEAVVGDDGAASYDGGIGNGEPLYEMIPNEVSRSIYEHPVFDAKAVASATYPVVYPLTDAQMMEVRKAFEEGEVTAPPTAWTDNQDMLWSCISRYGTEYRTFQPVLRETQITSKRSTITRRQKTSNRSVTKDKLPKVSAVNTMIGILEDGEWLQNAPAVRSIGDGKFEIVTEWTWALKWSALHYGGSLIP